MLATLTSALVLGAPTIPVEQDAKPIFGADPATWAPANHTAELLGADPATWTPGPVMLPKESTPLLGADPATWAPNSDCDSITSKDACDKGGCSWCLSGAVPPSCKTIDEAKQLPSAVFQCDNIGMRGAADCHSISSKDACDKDDSCSWCLSGAVPPACKTMDEAKQLPASVFQCDKLTH